MVIFRNNSEGIPECNMRLALNGSDYETVEILEDDVPDLEITNLKTDRGITHLQLIQLRLTSTIINCAICASQE